MQDPFRYLIEHSGLYPPSFTRTFGEESPHWYVASWYSRELSLRHDMVCTLLANLEPAAEKRLMSPPSKTQPKKAKTDGSEPSTSTSGSSKGESSSSKKESDSESQSSDDEEAITRKEMHYRIILLEGSPAVSAKQNFYAEKWGLSNFPDSYWDLIDVREKKFIEVKVTSNYQGALEAFHQKRAGLEMFSSLAIVNSLSGKIEWRNHVGGLNGETKVSTFIAKRRLILSGLDALETPMTEKKDLIEEIFVCKWFNNHMDEWSNAIWELRGLNPPRNYTLDDSPSLQAITVKRLLECLDDPRKREAAPVKWRGKILPEPMVRNITFTEWDDTKMLNEFFEIVGRVDENGNKSPQVQAYIEAQKQWHRKGEEERSSFSLISESEYGIPSLAVLEETLGIGAKGLAFDADNKNTVQQDYKPIPQERYHPWFTEIVENMNTLHQMPSVPFVGISVQEFSSGHPMGDAAQFSVSSIIKHYSKTKAALFASKITNTYSRLGRAYAPPKYGKNSGRANTVMFPIYATTSDEDGTKYRVCQGIIIRGPNHARVPTDRINFISVEILHHLEGEKYIPFIQNAHIAVTSNGTKLCIRNNSISRGDPNFLIFVNNSLFVACNLVGEIILTDPSMPPNTDLKKGVESFCSIYKEWINARVVEGLMMATTGGAQEEGFFAQMRKIFMIMMCLGRGQKSFSWDLPSLCNKTNECLLNRPFAMYFACAIIDLLKSWDDRTCKFNVDIE